MSFPRYPEYKDSGVEWLGDVPAHWTVQPCRFIVEERTAKNEGAECEDYLSLMANVGVMPYAEKGDVGNKKPEDLGKCKIVTKGDLVINSMNYGIGSYGLSAYSGVCSPVYIVLKPKNDVIESRFAFRIFENKAFQTYAQSFGNGILEHRCSINWDILKPIGVPVPPQTEQHAILTVLDRETAKIDALVAEQRRLMELLKEKRQAVISHAVTRGLNPHAPLKASGIEWLGDVPEHWNSPKLKSLAIDRPAAFTNGPFGSDLLTSELQDDGVPVIYIRDLKVGGYRRRSTSYVTSEKAIQLDKFRVDANDILIAKVGDPPGFCCTYPEGEPSGIICQDVIRIKPNSELVSSGYLCYLLNSQPGMEAIDSICIQLTRKRFSLADLHSLRLPLPPLTEQTKTLAYMDKSAAEFDTLTTEAQRAIDLLQERRTALISAAVTGQIDVRNAITT